MTHNKQTAQEMEYFVADKLKDLNIAQDTDEMGFYDFKIGNTFLEVKSLKLMIKNGKVANKKIKGTEFGMFDFHGKNQLDLLKAADAYVCFVIYNLDQQMILGFIEAKKITLKKKRRIGLRKILNLDLLSLKDFIDAVKRRNNG